MPSPLAVPALDSVAAFFISDQGFLVLIGLLFSSLLLLVRRWRRSSGIERVQYRWLLLGAVVFAVTLLSVSNLSAMESGVAMIVIMLSGWAIPACIYIAVARYRLFEIDRIISRTLSHTLVIAVLGALYFGMVTLITSFLPSQNALAVAGSTLAVAALFNPLRKRTQRAVDRRFNRSGYQAEAISEQFATRLREPLTIEELGETWKQTVDHALEPVTSGIWLRQTATPRTTSDAVVPLLNGSP
jgi:hypothetical protein